MSEAIPTPGKTSSEFYSLLLLVAVVLINGTDLVSIPVEQMTMLFAAILGYGGGRTLLKNTLAKQPGSAASV